MRVLTVLGVLFINICILSGIAYFSSVSDSTVYFKAALWAWELSNVIGLIFFVSIIQECEL